MKLENLCQGFISAMPEVHRSKTFKADVIISFSLSEILVVDTQSEVSDEGGNTVFTCHGDRWTRPTQLFVCLLIHDLSIDPSIDLSVVSVYLRKTNGFQSLDYACFLIL